VRGPLDTSNAPIPILFEILQGGFRVSSETKNTDASNQAKFQFSKEGVTLRASGDSLGLHFSCEAFYTSPPACLFAQMSALAGLSSSSPSAPMATLRRFRDEYLARTPSGKDRVRQYYRFSPEAIRIV